MMMTALAAAVTGLTSPAQSALPEKEKCYGVAKAGQNDCHTKAHSCAGSAKTDANGQEWISMPKGLCEKLAGGSLTPKS